MPYFCNFRYHVLTLVLLAAILQLPLAPTCFAELKKHRDKKISFSQPRIYSDSDLEQNPEEDLFENAVNEYLGVPYRRGGSGNKGFDCSGLTRKLYLEIYGINLPHNSAAQCRLNIFDRVPLNPDAFESRDLLFFQSKNKRINHVGIYLENGKFLHATSGKGVTVSDLNDSYWKRRLVASRRIKDAIATRPSGGFDSLYEDSSGTYANDINLGYSADIHQNLNLKIETFYSGSFLTPDFFLEQSSRLEKDMLLGSWFGLRAETAFQPARWLKITPSIEALDGLSWNNEINDRSWKVYGLETAIKPISSQWSFVLSLHSLLSENYEEAEKEDGDTDIGLHINYRVSNSMRFSITGNWEGSYLLRDKEIASLTHDLLYFNMFLTF